MQRTLVRVILSLMAFVWGCDRTVDPSAAWTTDNGVYILNEGAFLAGNAELSFYDPISGKVEGNLFLRANPGLTLGDVANDVVAANGSLYIVVNNSRRVDIVHVGTNKLIRSITTVGMPRRIYVASAAKAYVTNQDSTVSVLDLSAGIELQRIRVGEFPEGLMGANGKLYVMNGGFGFGHSISIIDMAADTLLSTLSTPDGPSYVVQGVNGLLYIVCTGTTSYSGPAPDTPGALLALDPATDTVVDSVTISGHPGKLAVGEAGSLYLLGPGAWPETPVWKLSTSPSLAVSTMSLVSGSFYGIGFDRKAERLYLAASGDFLSNGTVTVHMADGTLLTTLHDGVGVAPNGFVVVP